MKIVVEVVVARVVGDDLRYLVRSTPHPREGDPMATARGAVATQFPGVPLSETIVHSTSWRYDDASIVLTFLAYSGRINEDQLPHAIPLARADELANHDEGHASVAAHAIRHLAFLVAVHPHEYASRIDAPELAKLRRVSPDVTRGGRSAAA
jgi:hypothetical protein